MKEKLICNVFVEDNNKIDTYNIFDNYTFMNNLYKYKDDNDINTFSENVRHCLLYSYWAKCEWEVIITDVLPTISKEELDRLNNEEHMYRCCVNLECEKKVDVYSQVMLNWNVFINYLWENKHLIKEIRF